jgi:putative transposase
MPNHFHFMLAPKVDGCEYLVLKDRLSHLQCLSKVIGSVESSYAQAINKQHFRSGTVFQRKTKAKCLTQRNFVASSDRRLKDYVQTCFDYIHNNPVEADLVNHPGEWVYSSWHEYYGHSSNGICNKELMTKITGLCFP